MIRSWKQIADKSIEQGRLIKLFHAKEMTNYMEKIFVLKRIKENNPEASEEEIKRQFLLVLDDKEKEGGEFNEWYNSLLKFALQNNWPNDDIDVYVTKEEITYINQIQAPKEFRLFVLGTIIYGKFTFKRYGIPILNNLDRGFVYYMIIGEDNYNKKTERNQFITKYWNDSNCNHGFTFVPKVSRIQRDDGFVAVKTNIIAYADWCNYEATEGYLIHDYYRDPLSLSSKIKEWRRECPECGKKYKVKNRSKTLLCEDCYSYYRKTQEQERVKRYKRMKKCLSTAKSSQ